MATDRYQAATLRARPVRRRRARHVPRHAAGTGRRRAHVAHAARRQDRVHHLRPGPRGRAGGHLVGDAQGHRLDGALLSVHRQHHDLRHERRGHHHRPPGQGRRRSSGGRQMPGHYGGAPYNIVSLSSPVGTQVLHAVGIAMGAWVRGDDVVTMTQFGEGTSNQGEIHEAMNFAGVHHLPVIFVCENNGYAISVPLDRQVAGGSVAARAAGYGMPGVVVDGGDVLGCYAAAREAHERARRGEGPTLIEARVVRLTSHSSDDDQRRYRDPAEVDALKERDPIPQFAGELRAAGVLTDERDEAHPGGGQGGGQRGKQARRGAAGADSGRRARARLRRADPRWRHRRATRRQPAARGTDHGRRSTSSRRSGRRWTRRWSATTASWCWARTSARRAASSAPPRACGRSTATSASWTRRSPRA